MSNNQTECKNYNYLFFRLSQSKFRNSFHLKEKDFWHECVVFISKDNNLNKAHVKYLENRMYTIAKEAGRYQLENSNIPTQSSW